MDKALRRRAGADYVEIDTIKGFAKYHLLKARKLTVSTIAQATRGAGYTLTRVEVEVSGKLIEADCKTCAEKRVFIEISGSGQRVELEGEAQAGAAGRFLIELDAEAAKNEDHLRARLVTPEN